MRLFEVMIAGKAHTVTQRDDGTFDWPSGLPHRIQPKHTTVAECVLARGTGAINVDGTRIPFASDEDKAAAAAAAAQRLNHDSPGEVYKGCGKTGFTNPRASLQPYLDGMDAGRWPPNLLAGPGFFDPATERYFSLAAWAKAQKDLSEGSGYLFGSLTGIFVCPKPDGAEKEAGLSDFASKRKSTTRDDASWEKGSKNPRAVGGSTECRNPHPTVKPLALMRWLVRLVTRQGGVVLEPFAGSGTTAVAAIEEGCGFLAIERESEYVPIIEARVAWASRHKGLFDGPGSPGMTRAL